FFFFQAEDGIRDFHVTGVQTCALPISFLPRPCSSRNGSPTKAASPTRSSPPSGAPASRRCPILPRCRRRASGRRGTLPPRWVSRSEERREGKRVGRGGRAGMERDGRRN